MNNKIDDVLFSLLKAKDNITNNSKVSENDLFYKELLNGLDDLIASYTIRNKMSNKEIINCALSLYEKKNDNKFLEKINNLRPKRIITKVKNKIEETHKKKELKQKYEEEIVLLVKARLKSMVEDDRNKNISPEVKSKQTDFQKNKSKSVFVLDKDMAKVIDIKKVDNFIFQDNDNYFVYKKTDNINNWDIEKSQLARFSALDQAIVYSIDDISANDVRNDYDKFKNNYGNLEDYIIDKREMKKSHNNSIDINLETKQKSI